MSLIAFSGKSLCGYAGMSVMGSRLQKLIHIEPYRILKLLIALYLHIRPAVEIRKETFLCFVKILYILLHRIGEHLHRLCLRVLFADRIGKGGIFKNGDLLSLPHGDPESCDERSALLPDHAAGF